MDEHTRRRLPAEWENDGAILLSWPHKDTDWAGMLVRVTRCYVALSKAVIEAGQRLVIVAPDTSVPRRPSPRFRRTRFCTLTFRPTIRGHATSDQSLWKSRTELP